MDQTITISKEFPPNIEAIRNRFPLTGNEIFAYDNVIYHPGMGQLTEALIEHEKVHFDQQGTDPAGWWERYLTDNSFRYEMELEAHRMELRTFCRACRNRNLRWKYLDKLVHRMRMPTYGMTTGRTYQDISRELRQGILR